MNELLEQMLPFNEKKKLYIMITNINEFKKSLNEKLDGKYIDLAKKLLNFVEQIHPEFLTDAQIEEIAKYDEMWTDESPNDFYAKGPYNKELTDSYNSFINKVKETFPELANADLHNIIGNSYYIFWVGEGFPHSTELSHIESQISKFFNKNIFNENFNDSLTQVTKEVYDTLLKNNKNVEMLEDNVFKLSVDGNFYAVRIMNDNTTRKVNVNENVTTTLVEGQLYKVFDKLTKGAILYSQAKFLGNDESGYKFELINRKSDNIITLSDIANYEFIQTKDFSTKK